MIWEQFIAINKSYKHSAVLDNVICQTQHNIISSRGSAFKLNVTNVK